MATTAPISTRTRRRHGDRTVAEATATADTTRAPTPVPRESASSSAHRQEVTSVDNSHSRPTVRKPATRWPPTPTRIAFTVPSCHSAQPIPTITTTNARTYSHGPGSTKAELIGVHHLPSRRAGRPKATS